MSDTTKFTKGEWYNNLGIIRQDGTMKKIATISYSSHPKSAKELNCVGDSEEAEANAKLISSAPDLLDALNFVLKQYKYLLTEKLLDDGVSEAALILKIQENSAIKEAKEAIKKATT